MNHNHKYDDLLLEMESFGKMNDASVVDRSRKMLNITQDTSIFLQVG